MHETTHDGCIVTYVHIYRGMDACLEHYDHNNHIACNIWAQLEATVPLCIFVHKSETAKIK